MHSLILVGLGCVFASVPSFYPWQQIQSRVILPLDFIQHNIPFPHLASYQFRPRAMSSQPPPIIMITQDMRKPITSSDKAIKLLENLIKQQEITADVLKRIENTFNMTTKASLDLQNQQVWTRKARIEGTQEMPNFWTNRPEEIYVAEITHDPEEIYVAEIIHDAIIGDVEEMALKDEENERYLKTIKSKKKSVTKKASEKGGIKKTAAKASNKPAAKATTKRVWSSGGDDKPKKKQRKEEKEAVTRRSTTTSSGDDKSKKKQRKEKENVTPPQTRGQKKQKK